MSEEFDVGEASGTLLKLKLHIVMIKLTLNVFVLFAILTIFEEVISIIDDITKYRCIPVSPFLRRYIIVGHFVIPRLSKPVCAGLVSRI